MVKRRGPPSQSWRTFLRNQRTKHGATIKATQQVERRERLSRRKRWEAQDEDETYSATQLDREIVNPDQIRTVLRTFRDKLPEIFRGRTKVPKTLIFAKTDSHADDVIQIAREEFAQGNEFCKKVTYQATEEILWSGFNSVYRLRIKVRPSVVGKRTPSI